MYTERDHTFVVCAYKENAHLEETIQSLVKQKIKSEVLISTSTPNSHIYGIAQKYGIEVRVNPNPHLAGDDWNYAYDSAITKLVTVAHQDDIYRRDFLEKTLYALNGRETPILVFTDYYELREKKIIRANVLLRIKRLLNVPFGLKSLSSIKWVRLRILSLGCPICCPATTYVKGRAGDTIFDTTYVNSCDYKTWIDLARKEGQFVYVNQPLILHRIYAESATSKNLGENIRKKEDLELLSTLWPRPIAKVINSIYALSEKSNKL